jgi:hypothetical protein
LNYAGNPAFFQRTSREIQLAMKTVLLSNTRAAKRAVDRLHVRQAPVRLAVDLMY